MFDYIRVASIINSVSLGNVSENRKAIVSCIRDAEAQDCDVAVFPELCLTGYSVGDMLFQNTLQTEVKRSVKILATETAKSNVAVVVGAPLLINGSLYDCAVFVEGGKVRGIVTKTYLCDDGAKSERRWFASSNSLTEKEICSSYFGMDDGYKIPVGKNLIFDVAGAKVGVEIGEDLSAPVSVGSVMSVMGAEIILNPSATVAMVGHEEKIKALIKAESLKCSNAYVYTSSARGESTTDYVSLGVSAICEKGSFLSCNSDASTESSFTVADIDLGKIRSDRIKNPVFSDMKIALSTNVEARNIVCNTKKSASNGEFAVIKKSPFVPTEEKERIGRCNEIFNIQAEGLRRRLLVTGAKPVVGISGGLDSTLAILVAVEAQKRLGKPVSDVIGITMPCFGTTDRTYNNAIHLMELLGITSVEIPIKNACIQHAADIGQALDKYDLTYENMQARERTQVLMDYAGKIGGLVVGTGDLSELALGWCTYNADHMSMYGVNCGVPKTLVRWMVVSLAESAMFSNCREVLLDIADTPISPELLPPDEKGNIAQQTEDLVGPYSLHDFFIYYALRYGFEPEKIFMLACKAFEGDYDKAVIHKWLRSFYRRFFTQQFKRSCSPDGVKVGIVGISPRGDLKMPSDATFAMWVDAVDKIEL